MTTVTPIRIAHEIPDRPALFLAFECCVTPWQLGFTTGAAQRPRERHVPARHLEGVREEMRRAKERFGVPEDAPVLSGYEAGRLLAPPLARNPRSGQRCGRLVQPGGPSPAPAGQDCSARCAEVAHDAPAP